MGTEVPNIFFFFFYYTVGAWGTNSARPLGQSPVPNAGETSGLCRRKLDGWQIISVRLPQTRLLNALLRWEQEVRRVVGACAFSKPGKLLKLWNTVSLVPVVDIDRNKVGV